MAKAKFAYDEEGATFFYFVLSFLALILVPSSYYLWPSEPKVDDHTKPTCKCTGCQSKSQHLGNLNKWKKSKRRLVRCIIAFGWLIFFAVAYKCTTIQNEYVNWDPYEILGVRENAAMDEIKKAYRKLSLIYHPDKDTGDNDAFVKITKAYAALTDETARSNWEQYGNPDGPGATSFGIALPSWIVEKENSFVVLGIYALIFMVALPVSVGLWWYKSVKYGCDKVLIHTSELYYYLIHKTPNMAVKRALMILAASLEFAKPHNPEVIERPTDNVEVPRLIRDLPNLGEKNQERPLCFSYSIKTRAILHAHLSRMKLPDKTLEVDRCFIVRKCPYLIQEFVQCVAQLITLALSGRVPNMPHVTTLENAMKLSPSIIQALWEYQSPLLQLPHFTEDILRQYERKKGIKVKTIDQLARMKETERREALKNFTDVQYDNIRMVIASMPTVRIESKFEVIDDEDPNVITAGAIVTVTVKLIRQNLAEFFGKEDEVIVETEPEIDASKGLSANGTENIPPKGDEPKKSPKAKVVEHEKVMSKKQDSCDDADNDESEHSDQDKEWERKIQERVMRKHKVFESKPKKSHPVHCPYFPDDKQEYWWVYVVDRKRSALVTAPILVTSLVDTEEIELKFTAPHRAGSFSYTIICRSDSYVDRITQKQTTIDVKPAKEYIEPDYDIPEDDVESQVDEEDSAVEDSDLCTDSDD